jgi:hypothetical protein
MGGGRVTVGSSVVEERIEVSTERTGADDTLVDGAGVSTIVEIGG